MAKSKGHKAAPTKVRVIWDDAWSNKSTTFSERSLKKQTPFQAHDTGVLVRKDKTAVVIAKGGKDGKLRDVHYIPRKLVRKIVTLNK